MDLLPWQFAALLALLLILFITPFYSLISTGHKSVVTKNLPPQAAGGWPVIGHLRLLSGPELPHIILSNMADKYGPMFTYELRFRHVRPREIRSVLAGYDFAMFGLGKYGPYWRELRKISVQKLLSNRKIETLGHLCVTEIRALMKSLYNSCTDNGDRKAPSSLEMRKLFRDLSVNVMVRVVAGNTVGGENKGSREINQKWHETITKFLGAMGVLTVPDVLPYLK
ncbi:cytochrome P450 82A3-like [Sesamum indicum]|uniref:Cytochrome P450 82A3-like n=1 Tax=Sesamum indicum TaxID=4182 RepID=A0A6I9TRP1_SESIN|nr:cytochrome P450 82A3-like [Sesamum indicum]